MLTPPDPGCEEQPGREPEVAKSDAANCNPAAADPLLDGGAAAPSYSYEVPMSDSNPNTFFSPYPGTLSQSGGTNDDSFRAALLSHSAGSIERNQDAQFSSGRDQLVNRDVLDNRFHAERSARDSDLRHALQFAELKAELHAMRAQGLQSTIDELRADQAKGALADILAAVKAVTK